MGFLSKRTPQLLAITSTSSGSNLGKLVQPKYLSMNPGFFAGIVSLRGAAFRHTFETSGSVVSRGFTMMSGWLLCGHKPIHSDSRATSTRLVDIGILVSGSRDNL